MRHHSVRRFMAAALAVTPLVVACTPQSDTPVADSGPAATSPNPAALELSDLDQLMLGDFVAVSAALVATSRSAVNDMLVRTGVVEVLPSAREVLAGIDATLGTGSDVAAVTLTSNRPGGVREPATAAPIQGRSGLRQSPTATPSQMATPSPMSSQGAALGLTALGAAIGSTLRAGASGVPLNDDIAIDYTPASDSTPPLQGRIVDGSSELRIVKRTSKAVDGGTLSVDMDLRSQLDACPSADGSVVGTLSVDVRIDAVTASSRAGGRYTMEIGLTASVDDAARLSGYVIDVSGSASDTVTAPSDEGDATTTGWFVEGGSRATIAERSGEGLTVTGLDDVSSTRSSSAADEASVESFLTDQASIAVYLISTVLVDAEEFWRGGACVDVQLLPAGDPAAVQPGDELTVGIEATAATDGQPIEAPATAVATATGGTLEPSDLAQPLAATVRYLVPTDGSNGEVAAEVTSRRGIGRASLPIAVARAFVVDGQLDVFSVSGTKCGGISGAWELTLTASFEGFPFSGDLQFQIPTDSRTGTYTLSGSTTGGGITVDQSGSGTVEVHAAPRGLTLVFTGNAWTGGPVQVHSIEATTTTGATC